MWFRTIKNFKEFYNDARELRIDGHRRFPGTENSNIRHETISYELASKYGSFWTRNAGIANEIQGLILYDIPDISGRLSGVRPWAFQFSDIVANERGIQKSLFDHKKQKGSSCE